MSFARIRKPKPISKNPALKRCRKCGRHFAFQPCTSGQQRKPGTAEARAVERNYPGVAQELCAV